MQTASALLLRGVHVGQTLEEVKRRSRLFSDLGVTVGKDWVALEGVRYDDESNEVLLPSLADALTLYDAGQDIFCPVGCELDTPEHLQAGLIAHFKTCLSLSGRAVVVPSDHDASFVDVYPLVNSIPLHAADLSEFKNVS